MTLFSNTCLKLAVVDPIDVGVLGALIGVVVVLILQRLAT